MPSPQFSPIPRPRLNASVVARFAILILPVTVFAQGPAVSGTQTADLDDTNSNGVASPGEDIDYDIRLNNSGSDANNVRVTDTIDGNATLGAVMVGPIGIDETYAVTGNIGISVPAGVGVLVNDLDPDGGVSPGLAVESFDSSSTQGGTVAVAPDGSFTYTPPTGFTGTDSFTYKVRDAQNLVGLSPGVVTLNVGSPVWFVNDLDATPDDATAGTAANPFNSAAAFAARNNGAAGNPGDGHAIYVFSGSGATLGPFSLRASQVLLGQGVALSSGNLGFALATYSTGLPAPGAPPVITGASNAILLATNNTVRGLSVGNIPPATNAISGSSFGTLTLSDFSTSGTGGILDLSNGTLNATTGITRLDSVDCGTGISLSSVAGSGLTVSTGTSIANFLNNGMRLTNCTAPVALADLDLSTTAPQTNAGAVGIFASNCTSIASTSGTLSTADAVAVDIDNSALGLALDRVSVDGADRGIDLDTTTGTFSITGDGSNSANGSGGTLANTVNDGIVLSAAGGLSVAQLNIQNTGGSAVHGRNACSNLSFRHGNYSNIGTIPAPGLHAIDFDNTDGSGTSSVTGTLDIQNISVSGIVSSGLVIHNESDSLIATVNGSSSFTAGNPTFGLFGIHVEANAGAAVNLAVNGVTFDQLEGQAVRFEHDSFSPCQLSITGCTSTNGGGIDDSLGGGGISATASGTGALTAFITGNVLSDITGEGISLDGALGATQNVNASISGNTITATQPVPFLLGDGIAVRKDSGGLWQVLVSNNNLSPSAGSASNLLRGIYARTRDNGGTLTLEVADCTISGTDEEGFRLFSDQDLPGPGATTNLTLINNDISSTGPDTIGLRLRDFTTLCANIDNPLLAVTDTIDINLGTALGPIASVTQADPAGPSPNLSSENGGAAIQTTAPGPPGTSLIFSAPPCPRPLLPTP
ncbi:hypothetical protein HAHE_36510 [Haloferula helveola]|uniref:DUF11 domain-containing protein n=1 Tax=Haloferula helveola TaxID=490095 RepID=A0ABN6H8E0_9BACT|nr:hypothetical protein HAHE_36510 [Haloferula helveola]